MKQVICQECNKTIKPQMVKGDVIYPHRPDLYHKDFYQCPVCGNYKEIRQDDKKDAMFIVLPSKEVKQARLKVHEIIDPLWKSKKTTRGKIYRRLSKELKCDYHNNTCIDLEKLNKAYEIALEIRKEVETSYKETTLDRMEKCLNMVKGSKGEQ